MVPRLAPVPRTMAHWIVQRFHQHPVAWPIIILLILFLSGALADVSGVLATAIPRQQALGVVYANDKSVRRPVALALQVHEGSDSVSGELVLPRSSTDDAGLVLPPQVESVEGGSLGFIEDLGAIAKLDPFFYDSWISPYKGSCCGPSGSDLNKLSGYGVTKRPGILPSPSPVPSGIAFVPSSAGKRYIVPRSKAVGDPHISFNLRAWLTSSSWSTKLLHLSLVPALEQRTVGTFVPPGTVDVFLPPTAVIDVTQTNAIVTFARDGRRLVHIAITPGQEAVDVGWTDTTATNSQTFLLVLLSVLAGAIVGMAGQMLLEPLGSSSSGGRRTPSS